MPDVSSYNRILRAWAGSRLPEASQRMEARMHNMRSCGIAPTAISYNIMLRFWSGKHDVDKIQEILDLMKQEGVKLDLACMAQAVRCYSNVGRTENAEEYRMIDVELTRWH